MGVGKMTHNDALAAFAQWLPAITDELLRLMCDIRTDWSDETTTQIMQVVKHDHVRRMYGQDFTPEAAAAWVTDFSPVAIHFEDCKHRKHRQAMRRRNGRFSRNRRSWGRK